MAETKKQTEAERIAAMREEIAEYERKTHEDAAKAAKKLLKPARDFVDSPELKTVLEQVEEARIASAQFVDLASTLGGLKRSIESIGNMIERAEQEIITAKINESAPQTPVA